MFTTIPSLTMGQITDMRKELIPTSLVPPGGYYYYTQQETGVKLRSNNFDQLVGLVVRHRKANNLPIPFNVRDEIEDKVCADKPELCKAQRAVARPDRPTTLATVLRLTRTLFKARGDRVDPEEASRRATICSECDSNITPQGCTGCSSSAIEKTVRFVVGNRKTPQDSYLKSCKYCGCFNAAQVWIPLKALQSTTSEAENESLPSHCWKKSQ